MLPCTSPTAPNCCSCHAHNPLSNPTPPPCCTPTHAADYQLEWGLREFCAADIEDLCANQRERIEMAEAFAADGQVIACLEVRVRLRVP